MGLPTKCAHCQGHRRTEEALLVPRCLKPAAKPRGTSFNPPTLCICSAGVPLTGEGIAMTRAGRERRGSKGSKLPIQLSHSTTAQK